MPIVATHGLQMKRNNPRWLVIGLFPWRTISSIIFKHAMHPHQDNDQFVMKLSVVATCYPLKQGCGGPLQHQQQRTHNCWDIIGVEICWGLSQTCFYIGLKSWIHLAMFLDQSTKPPLSTLHWEATSWCPWEGDAYKPSAKQTCDVIGDMALCLGQSAWPWMQGKGQ